jgi:hypothetical protein
MVLVFRRGTRAARSSPSLLRRSLISRQLGGSTGGTVGQSHAIGLPWAEVDSPRLQRVLVRPKSHLDGMDGKGFSTRRPPGTCRSH